MLLMGQLTISMAIFNSFLYVYQRIYPINIPLNHYKIPLNHYEIPLNIAMGTMFHGFNNVEFYDSLAASRCFGGAVLLGRPRFVEHVHAPCCRTWFISWLCLGKRNILHDWGIQKRNLYESVLFCVILWGAQKSKQIQAIKWKESWLE